MHLALRTSRGAAHASNCREIGSLDLWPQGHYDWMTCFLRHYSVTLTKAEKDRPHLQTGLLRNLLSSNAIRRAQVHNHSEAQMHPVMNTAGADRSRAVLWRSTVTGMTRTRK